MSAVEVLEGALERLERIDPVLRMFRGRVPGRSPNRRWPSRTAKTVTLEPMDTTKATEDWSERRPTPAA
ncbi:hypothetical protein, partial [Streptomyces acidiscabies]|uniref:hypothetical protein n=1 Tax=Streptomyces acidiscabies TaxID=42234 RepID=UPI001F3FA34E